AETRPAVDGRDAVAEQEPEREDAERESQTDHDRPDGVDGELGERDPASADGEREQSGDRAIGELSRPNIHESTIPSPRGPPAAVICAALASRPFQFSVAAVPTLAVSSGLPPARVAVIPPSSASVPATSAIVPMVPTG